MPCNVLVESWVVLSTPKEPTYSTKQTSCAAQNPFLMCFTGSTQVNFPVSIVVAYIMIVAESEMVEYLSWFLETNSHEGSQKGTLKCKS